MLRLMQALIRINTIRDRARELGLTIPTICARAKVPPSTVYRWLNRETDPHIGAYEAICEKLDAVLDAEETRLREKFGGRRRPAA